MITVLSSITGDKDSPRDSQKKGKAAFVMYTDKPFTSKTWEIRKGYDRFSDPRRNSRAPKILSHLFSDTEYSIYIDGNMSLVKPPEEIVERFLGDYDFALFKHPKRDCLYDEAIRCAKAGLDDAEVIIGQVTRYEKDGYAKHKGLHECGVLIRRHTPKVIEFNNYWWAEYCRGSVRDQISFMYAADKAGLRIKSIDAPWYLDTNGIDVRRDDFIKMVPHKILNPQA